MKAIAAINLTKIHLCIIFSSFLFSILYKSERHTKIKIKKEKKNFMFSIFSSLFFFLLFWLSNIRKQNRSTKCVTTLRFIRQSISLSFCSCSEYLNKNRIFLFLLYRCCALLFNILSCCYVYAMKCIYMLNIMFGNPIGMRRNTIDW